MSKPVIPHYSPSKTGFLALRTAQDLFAKAERDLAALEYNPQSADAAFNFFVTAHHIADWAGALDSRDQHPLLKICRHIADGVKHFELTAKHHNLVSGVVDESYVDDGYFEPGYVEQDVHILLEPNNGLTNADRIDVLELARLVIAFWRQRLGVV
ncbi:hypothetical protein [Cupriavidus necator]|uniref:hypothetical protein n=1 Tax=Cupriavidus necator TaxID=106590 RepID=UPI0005B44009|nr:hypothetical protein [Cupriavidus necator]